MTQTLKEKLKRKIRSSQREVFLRRDFDAVGNYRQVTRALAQLQEERILLRAGYGVYTRPSLESDLPGAIAKVRSRLSGVRVKRHITIAGSTVLLGGKSSAGLAQTKLDHYKLRTSRFLLRAFPLAMIRAKSLQNLDRWESRGVWVSAHEEWRNLMRSGSDDDVISVMTGLDQKSNRLRQSAPYAGLLSDQTLAALR